MCTEKIYTEKGHHVQGWLIKTHAYSMNEGIMYKNSMQEQSHLEKRLQLIIYTNPQLQHLLEIDGFLNIIKSFVNERIFCLSIKLGSAKNQPWMKKCAEIMGISTDVKYRLNEVSEFKYCLYCLENNEENPQELAKVNAWIYEHQQY